MVVYGARAGWLFYLRCYQHFHKKNKNSFFIRKAFIIFHQIFFMENTNQPPNQIFGNQKDLPNATAVLVLGIISIVGCFCYGITGVICAIIALVLAGKDKKLYAGNPEMYTPSSLKNLNAGRTCAIIGLSLSALYFIMALIWVIIMGASLTTMPWDMYKQ